jgi:hypothetical protein
VGILIKAECRPIQAAHITEEYVTNYRIPNPIRLFPAPPMAGASYSLTAFPPDQECKSCEDWYSSQSTGLESPGKRSVMDDGGLHGAGELQVLRLGILI